MSEVKLPRGIRKQAQAAEKLEQDMAAAAQSAPSSTPVDQLGQPPAPAATPPVQPPAPAPAPVEPPPAQAQQPDLASQLATSEQRYRTLQGMMSSEMNQLRSQARDAVAAVEELKQQLAAKGAQPQSQAQDPKDVEAFGADLVEMVRRQASAEIQEAVRTHVSGIVSRLEKLEATLEVTGQNVAVTAEQQFFESLTRRVPDWRTVNADQRFLQWLGEADGVYGVPRQVALDNAVGRANVEHAAAIFEAFKKTVTPAPAPANALNEQVQPARSGSAAPAVEAPQAQTVSSADITKFYNDVRRGVYRGREAELEQIEAQINMAIAEGRVR